MRPNPGDEYTIAELNTVEWVSGDPPKVRLFYFLLLVQAFSIFGVFNSAFLVTIT